MAKRFLEIACFNTQSALIAAEAGADRIELCAGASVGGTTPSLADLKAVRESVGVLVNVMIRPRGGNFVYNDAELTEMKRDIELFKPFAHGFVFGVLDIHGQVDRDRNQELISIAAPAPCTFHRAFDEIEDQLGAVNEIAQCGFAAILTSGGKSSALEGTEELAKVVMVAEDRLNIIVGSGVRSSNLESLQDITKAKWYHSSALVDSTGVANKAEIQILRQILRS